MTSKIEFRVLLAFTAIYIIWGTTYLAIRIGVQSLPPFLMATMRFGIAGTIMLIYANWNKERMPWVAIINQMALGAFMLTLGQGVLFWAEKYISSGLTAVLISALPVWYIITDRSQWADYFHSKLTLLSIALGITGIVLLFKNQLTGGAPTGGSTTIIATLVVILSCFCWAVGSLYYKNHPQPGSLFQHVGWQLIGGTIACLLVSGFTGEFKSFSIAAIPLKAWGAVLYLAIAGSIVAYTAMYWLLARKPAAIVGTYAYVNPVIAVILGHFIANETVSLIQVIAMTIILIAAWLANTVKYQAVNTD